LALRFAFGSPLTTRLRSRWSLGLTFAPRVTPFPAHYEASFPLATRPHLSPRFAFAHRFDSRPPSLRSVGLALLDRRTNEIAPLGPRAVVVADVIEAEQVVQCEPLDRGAFTHPAVGD